MKVPLRWLEEFVTLPTRDPEQLALALSMVGHGVEGYQVLDSGWTGVVVGEVIEIAEHPRADRIRVCRVETGSGEEQIVCGAWNFDEGARVAVALPGAVLPGGLEIGRRVIREVESNGMICSERELGLGDDHAGILVLDGSPELGRPFSELVELPDVVFDLEITTNRPDALSLLGIARDLAAHFRVGYQVPPRALSTVEGSTALQVSIEDPDGCRRFTARELREVTVGPAPLWVRHRLQKAGIRAISNVVDVTNYVMLELGHPLHAFDADRIAGMRLVVRRAGDGETLTTLDGEERALTPEDLVICDVDGPTSLSGTMGGARSEVTATTTSVIMEAASWDPPTIMYMARRHDLRSEASTRFERGVDPNLADEANRRAAGMVAELAGGQVLEGAVDVVTRPIESVSVALSMKEVHRILGPVVDAAEVAAILTSLGMSVTGTDPFSVVVPTFRPDVTRAADLIEEVARIHGFDRFPASLPTGHQGRLTAEQRRLRRIHQLLSDLGLSQTVTLPFVGPDDLVVFGIGEVPLLRVKNPLRDEEGRLRPSLLPSLLGALRYNLSHGIRDVALFETGKVFLSETDPDEPRLPAQPDRLAWAVTGRFGTGGLDHSPRVADGPLSLALARHLLDRLHIEGAELVQSTSPGFHPGRTAELRVGTRSLGFVGELDPEVARSWDLAGPVAAAELDLGALVEPVPLPQAVPPSVFPPVDFDLSFLVPASLPIGELTTVTSAAAGDLLEGSQVFDHFTGEGMTGGERAVAIRFRLRAVDRTLTSEEVAPVREAMIHAATVLGARLRGA